MESSPRARRYGRRRLALHIAHLALMLLGLILLVFSPLGEIIAGWARMLAPGPWLALLVFTLVLGVAGALVRLPLEAISYRMERSYGLSETSPGRWAWELLKAKAVGAAIGLPLLFGFYWCLLRWPRGWWLPTGGLLFLAGILLARLGPTLILPIFVRVERLDLPALRRRLRDMCAREGVRVLEVRKIGLSKLTLKANAAFAGLGRSRRILLADTLLDHFEEEEVEAVVAHELGHRCLRHVPKGIALGFCVTVAGLGLASWVHGLLLPRFGFRHPSELAALPLLALVLFLYGLLVLPLQNAIMRRWEFAADRFAARATSRKAISAALRRLGERNLSDPNPPRLEEVLLHDHPSLGRRIQRLSALAGTD